ncbi:MAG: cytochrome c [Pseudomonadales bacterium]|nr:cytochrome c [Pseudomonadales bacterium]
MGRLLIVISLVFSAAGLNAADIAAGAAGYALCASCHGAAGEGISAMNAPKLAGQSEWYLKSQLLGFKAGHRGATAEDGPGVQMRGMAGTLVDDAAVENVSAFIATFPPVESPVTIQGDAAQGKGLYALCASCHGLNGEGNAAMNGPRLAGQNDWYLRAQLSNFRKGLRGTAPGDVLGIQMRGMAITLVDDQAVLDVVSYINTLR